MNKIIALVTGGFTGESVVSFKSSAFVESQLDSKKYDVFKIVILKDEWYYEDKKSIKHPIDRNDFSIKIGDKKITFDAVFIMLHGSPGEDGKLQGYFDLLGIPYTSCDALTSSITMNKGYTKAVVDGIQGLHVAKSVQLFGNSKNTSGQLLSSLSLPLFIKPNSGGSSIGMSKVTAAEELPGALEKAFNEDTQVLVEEFIQGREFSVGVYNGKDGIAVLPATEVIPSNDFFDFEAKYTPGATEEITPGRMTNEEKSNVERIVKDVYIKLNCRGMVRIDYFLQAETSNFYFVEINTIPGQTAQSFIPQQVKAAGMNIGEFYGELIEKALEK
ncbi:D-alanine--D-alanine ligase [Daejeonella lutea]|uniref:D-alanine--D-alanine ligase n=1 Tax=Daejeonella lutea TaxID=572036 RepID=A0A1T5AI68_9SPHI|nr:D-alanine--D-alanine ligase [Daejeonella lutea]SKB34684.1 D-alanine-D-alanine ligase [Daejeonella lutea]